MLLSVSRSKIFQEYTPEEQEYWFAIKEKAVAHHVDSLYYNVFIKGDKLVIEDEDILNLVCRLSELKEEKQAAPSASLRFFGLEVAPYGSDAIYIFRLQMPEVYDIFFAKNITNDDTPRIHVQIRTNGILTLGLYEALEESFGKVKEILEGYHLEVDRCDYNRFDYAFHTNVVQKASEYFSPDNLDKHLISAFRRWGNEGAVPHRKDEDLDIDYFYLGRRKANYLFFRAYEKTKEVVQMNYKCIFFEKWFERGLISRYDKYVLEYAYKLQSYNTGMLVGRIKWYLEYGKDQDLKLELADILDKYSVNSSNNRELAERIKGIFPPTTKVFNFEFESKKKFYTYFRGFIKSYNVILGEDASRELVDIYRVLALRRFFLDIFMTDYVSFVDNRRALVPNELDWWRRIRCCRIDDVENENKLEARREYSRNLNMQRQTRKLFGGISNFHIYKKQSVDFESGFGEDICDAISFLNDNDVALADRVREDLSRVDPIGYREVKHQRWRQLRPVLKKEDDEIKKKKRAIEYLPYSDREELFKELNTEKMLLEAQDYLSRWRCIRCDNVFEGEKELTQITGRSNVPPYQEGICRRCLKIYRDLKNA